MTQCFNGLGIAVVYYGEGRHFENVSAENRAIWLRVLSKQPLYFELPKHIADLETSNSFITRRCASTFTPHSR